jgi:hypothetical protein
MINFVIKEDKRNKVTGQIRKMVTVSTSMVLVVYIIIAGGMTGWTVWLSSRQKQTSAENDNLTRQINDLFDSEVVIRNLANRAGMVEDYLHNRGNASNAASLVNKEGFNIIKWEYIAGGLETVGVTASAPAQLKDYADYLGTNYNVVQPTRIEWDPDNGWVGTFIFSERKKS